MTEFDFSVWSDIEPIPQDDGPNPVVSINYANEFVKLMDLFRGVLAKGEYSERVLTLTEELLSMNPGSYTVWQYRRACLKALNSDLTEEVKYMDTFADENPKNYQIWQHRRVIVAMIGDGSREKEFCEKIFEEDAKNYHAWAHRQWAVQTFNLWDGEIEFVDKCLEEDVRNNSAWNHRWFVIHKHPNGATTEVVSKEITYTCEKIELVAKNESAWNYLRGIVNTHPTSQDTIVSWLRAFVSSEGERSKNYFALGLLADIRESSGTEDGVGEAISLFERLVDADPMRSKSWTRRIHLASIIKAK